jgi:hypothetical protein
MILEGKGVKGGCSLPPCAKHTTEAAILGTDVGRALAD